jgi:hypothetical protein
MDNIPIPAQSTCPRCNLTYDTWKMVYCRRYSPVTGYICVDCREISRMIRREQFYHVNPIPPDNVVDLT